MSGNINTENNFTLSTISSVGSPKYDFVYNKNKSSFYENNKVLVWIGIAILVVVVFYNWFNKNYTCTPNDKQPIKQSLSKDISERLYKISKDRFDRLTDPAYMDKYRAKLNSSSDSSKNMANSVIKSNAVVASNAVITDSKKLERFINKINKAEHFNKENISDNDVNTLVNIIDNQLANNFIFESIYDELINIVKIIEPKYFKNMLYRDYLLKKLSDRSDLIKKLDKLNKSLDKLKEKAISQNKNKKIFNNLYDLLKQPITLSRNKLDDQISLLNFFKNNINTMNNVEDIYFDNKENILNLITEKINIIQNTF